MLYSWTTFVETAVHHTSELQDGFLSWRLQLKFTVEKLQKLFYFAILKKVALICFCIYLIETQHSQEIEYCNFQDYLENSRNLQKIDPAKISTHAVGSASPSFKVCWLVIIVFMVIIITSFLISALRVTFVGPVLVSSFWFMSSSYITNSVNEQIFL